MEVEAYYVIQILTTLLSKYELPIFIFHLKHLHWEYGVEKVNKTV